MPRCSSTLQRTVPLKGMASHMVPQRRTQMNDLAVAKQDGQESLMLASMSSNISGCCEPLLSASIHTSACELIVVLTNGRALCPPGLTVWCANMRACMLFLGPAPRGYTAAMAVHSVLPGILRNRALPCWSHTTDEREPDIDCVARWT